jgi:hypothetical protein
MFVARLARARGKEVAPMVEHGPYVAYPYSTKFHYLGMRQHGTVVVMESPAMSNNVYDTTNRKKYIVSEFEAVAFVKGRFDGSKLTPFEQYGSVLSLLTYVTDLGTVRYPDISSIQGQEAYVFSSFNAMLEHASLLAHYCIGDVASMIEIPIPPETVLGAWDEDADDGDAGLSTNDNENKSYRQKLLDWFAVDSSAKSPKDIMTKFPLLRAYELENILLYCPALLPLESVDGQVLWSSTHDEDLNGDIRSDGDLESCLTLMELKQNWWSVNVTMKIMRTLTVPLI